ncbi:hypothetical protein TCAL_04843 [Tigriopus californicus]|uniref:Uncharacterized protein n=1 Tax=Tigriopus californicus TaxID=6832 RepID=A0A553NX92_TIGCA|nr:hypothetical protein TCAL_04843 [Tigriopus californicus]
MNNHFCNVIVVLGEDGDFVSLGQMSLDTRMKEVTDMVLTKKNLDGLGQHVFLGYMRPYKEIVLLPAEAKLSDAKSAIIRDTSTYVVDDILLQGNLSESPPAG